MAGKVRCRQSKTSSKQEQRKAAVSESNSTSIELDER